MSGRVPVDSTATVRLSCQAVAIITPSCRIRVSPFFYPVDLLCFLVENKVLWPSFSAHCGGSTSISLLLEQVLLEIRGGEKVVEKELTVLVQVLLPDGSDNVVTKAPCSDMTK